MAKEALKLGAKKINPITRGVTFQGDLGFIYKANLNLRTALRILASIEQFKVRNEKELYKKIHQIEWENWFGVDQTFAIDTTVFSPIFKNSLFVAQKTKDAIVDRFKEQTGERPSVDTSNPDIRINIHISREKVNVSLDSSGQSLHKRGYRSEVNEAPINETLAAGILMLTDWNQKTPLIDPMCGSGTFLIEGAMIAANIPANAMREDFCFMHWKNFDEDLYELIRQKSLDKIHEADCKFYGFDKDPIVLSKARENIAHSGLEEFISVDLADFTKFRKPIPESGTLIFNPPYGIKIKAEIPELYKAISDTLKKSFTGYTAWVFTSSEEGLKNLALKHSEKIKLYNSTMDAWLVKYSLYEGSKLKKNQEGSDNG